MAPRPSFNDGSSVDDVVVVVDDGTEVSHRSLRTPISTYQKHVRYAVFEFQELLDSSSISAQGWSHIAQTIFRNYELFDAFVILHGTDSLAYTCSALSFMLQNLGKPVILTGSQAPMLELQNDATDNLLGSLIIAGHFMIPEVCLFFNYRLLRGNRSTKISASDFSAFDSPNAPPLYVHFGIILPIRALAQVSRHCYSGVRPLLCPPRNVTLLLNYREKAMLTPRCA